MPGQNIGERRAVFERYGSAPDIAGKVAKSTPLSLTVSNSDAKSARTSETSSRRKINAMLKKFLRRQKYALPWWECEHKCQATKTIPSKTMQ